MTTDSPDLFDVVDDAIKGALGAMRIIGIGTINSYDPVSQAANVSSALKFCYYDADEEELVQYTPGAIANIPVLHPSSGGFFSAMPVASGDQGVILTCDRALDSWKARGGEGHETRDARRFDFADSLFLPCGRSLASALTVDAIDPNNEFWIFGEESPSGIRVKIGKGKIEFGTKLVSFLEQIVTGLNDASKVAQATGTSTVLTLLGTQPLSNAGTLAGLAVNLATTKGLLNSIRGTL